MKYKVKISQEMQELKLQQSTWLVAKLWHVNWIAGERGVTTKNNKQKNYINIYSYRKNYILYIQLCNFSNLSED